MKIAASFLTLQNNIKEKIKLLERSDIDYLHLDVMDGIFVENKTASFLDIKNLVSDFKKPLDVHLMVSDVIKYIDIYSELKPLYITFHLEAVSDVMQVVNHIKRKGCKVGISIKPSTDVDKLTPYLNEIDLILVMSVSPGKGGQAFIKDSILKIDKLKQIKNNLNYSYLIEVDGGINNETIKLIKNADISVVGSYITNSDNYSEKVDELLKGGTK